MKRTLLTAAFAALALGAVQAAGLDWGLLGAVGGYSSVGTSLTSKGRTENLELGSKWTVLANVNINETCYDGITEGKWPVILGVSGSAIVGDDADANGPNTSPWRVLITGSNKTIGATDVTFDTDNPAPTLNGAGTHEVAIVGNGNTLSYYWDGALLGSITISDAGAVDTITWGGQNPGNTNNNLPAGYEMDIAYVVGKDYGEIQEAIQALPEPTALALLALGVAGVALRRRAA